MSFKKFDGSAWQPINPKQLKGIPYTGTLPATLTGTKVGYLHKYKVYGNAEQEGTPTPENPIMPSGCGERTKNLFDSTHHIIIGNVDYIGDVYPANKYRINNKSNYPCYYKVGESGTAGTVNPTSNVYINASDIVYVWISVNSNKKIGITESATIEEYEPYGYKLPILSNDTPTNIYLGEVETTRRIKKLVFDGTENWRQFSDGNIYILLSPNQSVAWARVLSTHFTLSQIQTNGSLLWFVNNSVDFDTVDECKQYLASQYAAGTPVTIWYVLAEPETAVVNEPLMKIGDYADTIDSTQTTVQIPTSAGSTTISWAGEGLAPSEFDSIQEWVDIPTYTYTNGAWVEDN